MLLFGAESVFAPWAAAADPTADLGVQPAVAAEPPPEPLYVVYVNWDAFGPDLYERANLPPYAGTPNLNQLLAEGTLFTQASTGVPSVTAPMQTTLVTGAWPSVTGLYFRGYDKEANLLRETGRETTAETIAEVAARGGLTTASIQQFTLLDRGTFWDDPAHLYLEPGGSFTLRVAQAWALYNGLPVASRRAWVTMPESPRFLALYADELDALGHNEHPVFGLPPAVDEAGRLDRVLRRLTGQDDTGLPGLDEGLGQLIRTLRERGVYDQTIIALAGDHGMTGLSGPSSLPDLLATLTGLGYRVQFLRPGESAAPETQVVVWSAGLAAHLAFRQEVTPEDILRLTLALSGREWYGGHYTRADLDLLGAHSLSGDLLVWPKPPHHFKADNGRSYPVRGQHDTPDSSSRLVFLALAGPGIRKGLRVDTPVSVVDLAPTLAHLMNLPPPSGAQGRILTEALETPLGEAGEETNAQDPGGR